MQFNNYIFLVKNIVLHSLLIDEKLIANALVGHNIRNANPDEFPFIAGIIRAAPEFVPERDTICTAALISKKDILTADHCMEDEVFNGIQIIIGSIDLVSTTKYYVAWWISYDQWANIYQANREFHVNDITIIKLTQTVADGITFASLSYLSYNDLKRKKVVVVGWGEINNGSCPRILQTARVKVLRYSNCERKIKKLSGINYEISQNVVCSVGKPYTLVIRGDSGGPVLYNNKIVAINTGTCPLPQVHFHPDKVNIHTLLETYEQYLTHMVVPEPGE